MPHAIVFNPASGRGKAQHAAESLREALRCEGHESSVVPISEAAGIGEEPGERDRVLFVVGGDGTVHRSLDLARRACLAIYHIPMGTENLFSREFGMKRDVALAARSLEAARFRTIDLATCAVGGGVATTFAIMCSVGPDAAVIRRLSATRKGPIRHASYVGPIARELLSLRAPTLSIETDGRMLARDEPGMVVVANSRQYAMRVDPAHGADMSDGMLDVVFFPAETRVELLMHVLAARFRRADESPGVRRCRSRRVRVTSRDVDPAFQLDGEAGAPSLGGNFELDVGVLAASVRVLLPASGHR